MISDLRCISRRARLAPQSNPPTKVTYNRAPANPRRRPQKSWRVRSAPFAHKEQATNATGKDLLEETSTRHKRNGVHCAAQLKRKSNVHGSCACGGSLRGRVHLSKGAEHLKHLVFAKTGINKQDVTNTHFTSSKSALP